jgi:hypothetical protein
VDDLADDFSLPLSIATLFLITVVFVFAVLRSRSAYREANS